MAPQNSTLLLNESIESTSELLSHCSPILPLLLLPPLEEKGNVVHGKKSICSNAYINNNNNNNTQQEDELPIWICGEPRFISGVTNETTCNDVIEALINDEISTKEIKHCISISNNYVITENWHDVEQSLSGDTQILPLWMAWGNSKYEVKFKLKINKNKDGLNKIVSSMNNHNDDDDVVNNKHNKKLKKSANTKTKIVLKLISRLLKQGEDIQKHLSIIREKSMKTHQQAQLKVNQIPIGKHPVDSKIGNSFKMISNDDVGSSSSSIIQDGSTLLNDQHEDNELFLLVKNDKEKHMEYRQVVINRKINAANKKFKQQNQFNDGTNAGATIPATTTTTINCTEYEQFITPKRKHRTKINYKKLRANNLNTRLPKSPATVNQDAYTYNDDDRDQNNLNKNIIINSEIYNEMSYRILELNQLLLCEKNLLINLSDQSAKYHLQNQYYINENIIDMHNGENDIDEIQQYLNKFAKEIIKNELDLQNVKCEITKQCEILYNLKRMLKMTKKQIDDSSNSSSIDNFDNIEEIIMKTAEKYLTNEFEIDGNNKPLLSSTATADDVAVGDDDEEFIDESQTIHFDSNQTMIV